MTAMPGVVFTCDSRQGCAAHAMVAGSSVDEARVALTEALGWFSSNYGDLCPQHVDDKL